jgi:cell division protein FtsL
MFEDKVSELEEELHTKEEDMYKVQGKVFALESKLEQKELEKNEKLEDLHADWMSKYEGMME